MRKYWKWKLQKVCFSFMSSISYPSCLVDLHVLLSWHASKLLKSKRICNFQCKMFETWSHHEDILVHELTVTSKCYLNLDFVVICLRDRLSLKHCNLLILDIVQRSLFTIICHNLSRNWNITFYYEQSLLLWIVRFIKMSTKMLCPSLLQCTCTNMHFLDLFLHQNSIIPWNKIKSKGNIYVDTLKGGGVFRGLECKYNSCTVEPQKRSVKRKTLL